MKQTTKAWLCLLLVFVTLFSFAGCKKDSDEPPAGTAPPIEGDANDPYSNFPDQIGVRDYDMKPFRIATTETDPTSFFVLQAPEEYTGQKVSDAMFNRDMVVRETYGIDIDYILYNSASDLQSAVAKTVMGQTQEVEMIASELTSALIPLATAKHTYNILDLPIVNMDHPWWASYFANGVTFKNRLPYGASMAVGAGYFSPAYTMICNLNLARDVTLEDGTPLDMYALVENGEWTLDVMMDIITDYTEDVDGDEVISVYNDKLAYAHIRSDVTAAAHFIAAGGKYSEVNRSGHIEVNLANAETEALVTKLAEMFDMIENNYDAVAFDSKGDDMQPRAFTGDRALLFGNSMTYVNDLIQMKSDYAIIPCPKASTDQKEYYTSVNTWTAGFIGFAGDIADPDFVGYAAEILGWASYYRVKPAVYDETLRLRLVKDERQIPIMDTIYANLYIDHNFIENFGASTATVSSSIMDASKNYKSTIDACKEAIAMFVSTFESNNA